MVFADWQPGNGIAQIVISRPHSLPSFPRKRESRTVLPKTGLLPIRLSRIPAYAGMTVGDGGNDGCGAAGARHPLILKPVAIFPLILNLLKDGKDGSKAARTTVFIGN